LTIGLWLRNGYPVHADVVLVAEFQEFPASALGPVNTKNWYRKGADLCAEFGNEMPFGRKNLLRGFGKDACGRQYAIVR
jgi:hypothetical protein